VRARDLFGAGEGSPAYLELQGSIDIETPPDFDLRPGHCAGIVTGGSLPEGADAVVMVEHTQDMGAATIEVRRAVAPGENVMLRGEDAEAGAVALAAGRVLRPQEVGLLAALGVSRVTVRRRPRVGIVSTGDELVPVEDVPRPGQVRDVNSATLAALVRRAGGVPVQYGLVPDEQAALDAALATGAAECDVLLVSGGSSVGVRDLTLTAVRSLHGAEVLCHGVAVSPGKPLILARVEQGGAVKAVWGLPGQVASAQVVMQVLGAPFLRRLAGDARALDLERPDPARPARRAVLARNLASKQGREDYVRVRLEQDPGEPLPRAVPVLGKSGLLRTLLHSNGLVRIPADAEGLEAGEELDVRLFDR
jgi:molybdopterin molybdotransferase